MLGADFKNMQLSCTRMKVGDKIIFRAEQLRWTMNDPRVKLMLQPRQMNPVFSSYSSYH
jgi:hypothetical protein